MKDKCTYCGSSRNIQDDHIQAQSKGGVRTVKACAKCNQSKGDKQLMVWLRWIKQNDTYRWNRMIEYNGNKKNDIAVKINKIREE